jgi:hypothetical protein
MILTVAGKIPLTKWSREAIPRPWAYAPMWIVNSKTIKIKYDFLDIVHVDIFDISHDQNYVVLCGKRWCKQAIFGALDFFLHVPCNKYFFPWNFTCPHRTCERLIYLELSSRHFFLLKIYDKKCILGAPLIRRIYGGLRSYEKNSMEAIWFIGFYPIGN